MKKLNSIIENFKFKNLRFFLHYTSVLTIVHKAVLEQKENKFNTFHFFREINSFFDNFVKFNLILSFSYISKIYSDVSYVNVIVGTC